jgi:hypothetical protein
MTKLQRNNDSVNAYLEYGSVVIPKKYTPQVMREMKKDNINPYGKPSFRNNEQKAILEPNELVINKSKVKQVIPILNKLKIKLPNL